MKLPNTPQRLKIDKANTRVTLAVALAAIVVVFSLVSARALIGQGAHQRRVVNAKNDTVKQLEQNIQAANTLSTQYQVFTGTNPNVLGGDGKADDSAIPPNGNNARIVLDALPTSYDFPALISSLTKVMNLSGVSNMTIGGSDQSDSFSNQPAGNPQPVPIAQIPMGGEGSYGRVQHLVKDLERSVRPYDINTLQFSGDENQMTLTLSVTTFYQPAKIIEIDTKEVQ